MKIQTLFVVIAVAAFVTQAFLPDEGPADKAALGEMLFFDPVLSRDRTISCASCHKPAFAFADTLAVSHGVKGRPGTRNTPSAMNLSLQRTFFWDGRAQSLEAQALAPIANPDEMDLPVEEAVQRLKADVKYNLISGRYLEAAPIAQASQQPSQLLNAGWKPVIALSTTGSSRTIPLPSAML